MQYRIAMLCGGQVVAYWCGGNTHWTTDKSRAEPLDLAAAMARADKSAETITRENFMVEKVE